MALRTAQQYLDSLRDNRVVYYAGERIKDVVAHPHFGLRAIENSHQYGKGDKEDAEILALRTMKLADGDLVHRWNMPPRSREDLLAYVQMEETMPGDAHGAMAAGLTSLGILAIKLDAKNGTNYTARIEKYTDWYARNDLHGAFAMTDAKGDRSKPPSGQVDPDLWLRVVERRKDGIVIRGAKTSVSSAAHCNELLVLPTHAMGPADADWSVACAVPANAPGVVMISNYAGNPWGEKFKFDKPISHSSFHHDATVIFNDVFVPNDRVFMDGEFAATREMLGYFTSLHRTGVLVKEPRDTKKLIGGHPRPDGRADRAAHGALQRSGARRRHPHHHRRDDPGRATARHAALCGAEPRAVHRRRVRAGRRVLQPRRPDGVRNARKIRLVPVRTVRRPGTHRAFRPRPAEPRDRRYGEEVLRRQARRHRRGTPQAGEVHL